MSSPLHLLRVIPATKIPLPSPQILTYFSAKELPPGSLVSVPIHKRKATGVVISCEKLDGKKMEVRKADFELRPILKIINPGPILDEKQIKLAEWMSEYYYCSIGPVVKMMIPTKTQNSKLKTQNNDLNRVTNQTLILTPEISMAKKLLEQYNRENTAIIHSGLTSRQYLENWHKIKEGEAKIIIGTRMALFAPFNNLTEIIMEDEQDFLYKSQQTPRYHTRETAIKLAGLWNAKITLKSGTPSIEALWLAEKKKAGFEKTAISHTPLATSAVDLRAELKAGNFSIFSRELREKINAVLEKKQQIILFINRRGASTVLMCRDCGYVPKCPNCEVPFVYHLSPVQFICHHCGHSEIPPVLCPNCLGTRIKFFGAGTQKVETEFKKLFPNAKISRFDSDVIKTAKNEQEIINNFQNSETQVLIGTQMIFGKNLPAAPLVAMMLADTLLHLPDFRSNERTFQLISRLKNLSAEDFILQTYSPENPAIRYALENDYAAFYKEEIQNRAELFYPPFSQLIKLIYAHKSAKKAGDETKILAEKLKQQIAVNNKQLTGINKKTDSVNLQPLTILGPSPAFISKIAGRYVWQIILKSKITDLKLRNKILSIVPPGWVIDIDPLQII